MKCKFCDVPKYGYYGDVSVDDLKYQIKYIIEQEACRKTKRFNVHYARMGEPTFNLNVLSFTMDNLDKCVKEAGLEADTIHPVVSTMLPKRSYGSMNLLIDYLKLWCDIKNKLRKGEAGLQFSINSTDNNQRKEQFSDRSYSLESISSIADALPMPVGRKYTLNFAVTENTILDASRLNKLFDKDKFIVKITPIHQTKSAIENSFDVTTTYDNYDVYEKFEQPLLDLGWDVIVFVPSKEEDSDRITCGNALIAATVDKPKRMRIRTKSILDKDIDVSSITKQVFSNVM